MRLTPQEIQAIKETFLNTFDKGNIYLFGSRVDDTKRGGDIDLEERLPYNRAKGIRIWDKIMRRKIIKNYFRSIK
jgi:hypothetical protein